MMRLKLLILLAAAGAATLVAPAGPSPIPKNQPDIRIEAQASHSAPAPIPALDRLKIFLGIFDVTESYDKSELFPNAGQARGLYKSHAGPGNFSYITDFWSWDGPEGNVSGHKVMTWDSSISALKRYTFDDDFPQPFISTGTWQGDALTFDGKFDFSGATFHFHDTTTADASGSFTMQETFQKGDPVQKRTPMLTMTAKKAPASGTATSVPAAAQGTPTAAIAERTGPQPPPAPTLKDLSPGLQKMAFLVGAWHYTQKFEKGGMTPDGATGEGNYTAVVGPGGQSILTDFAETAGPMAGISAHEVFTWDGKQAQYSGYAFVSNAPGCFLRTGAWEKKQLVFTRDMEMHGQKFRMRYVYNLTAPDSLTIETYSSMGDAPLALSFVTTAKRQQ